MLPKSILDAAKAFLCWDVFPDMAIQLVALQSTAAFYYPPDNGLQSIVAFYDPQLQDFTEPLFLLFHEAGHACQWRQMKQEGQGELFARCMGLDKGAQKAAFERGAWRLGSGLFVQFSRSQGLSTRLYDQFTAYGRRCAASYKK